MLACGALSCTSTHTCHARLVYVLLHSHSYVSYTTVRSLARPHVLLLSYFQFSCTCTHATLLRGLLHLHTYVMLRCCTFSCTCTHASQATLLYFPLRLHTNGMLRYRTPSCTCTHAYVSLRYVLLHLHTYLWHATIRCLSLAHVHVTPGYCTFSCTCKHVMLPDCTFSCTRAHTSHYATARSAALAHVLFATPLHVLMHSYTYPCYATASYHALV